jgi:hypothetical protein
MTRKGGKICRPFRLASIQDVPDFKAFLLFVG